MNGHRISLSIALALAVAPTSACVRIVTEADLLPGTGLHPPAAATAPSLEIRTSDGTHLRGEAFTGAGRRLAVVYYGGNAEIVTSRSWLRKLADGYALDVYAVNYRGFGPSEGKAGLDAIEADALEVFDAVSARPEVEGRPLLVYGYSLGTTAALTVAARRPVAGVVLMAAPSDASEVVPAMRRGLPWYTRMFVRLRPEPALAARPDQPLAIAPKVTAPLLSIHGTRDTVIGIRFGREVFDAAASPNKSFCVVEGGEHLGLFDADGGKAKRCLQEFLRRF